MADYQAVPGAVGRVFFLKLLEESRPHSAIEEFLASHDIEFAVIHGIGGMSWARLAVFSPEEKKYYPIDVEAEPGRVLEVVSIIGNSVKGPGGAYYTHLHASVAKSPSQIYAGHLVDARVNPFLELTVIEVTGVRGEVQKLLSHRWS